MRITYLATTIVAAALCLGTAHAQSCGPVSDEAGVLQGTIKANSLIDQGADVHVVAVRSISQYGPNLASVERAYEKRCSNWRSPGGGRKANLITIMVAPNDHMKNIFLGSIYDGMFSGSDGINLLYANAANADFRSGEWVDGVNATIQAMAAKVHDYHHPAPSGASHVALVVILLMLGLIAFFLILFMVIHGMHRKKEERLRNEAAQQDAIRARDSATDAFTAMPKDNSDYQWLAGKYANLSNSMQNDPTTTGLSADTYVAIGQEWRRFEDRVNKSVGTTPSGTVPPAPASTTSADARSNRARKRDDWYNSHRRPPITPETPGSSPPYQYQPVPSPSPTVVVQGGSSGNDLVTGMMLGEMLDENRRPEREVYREPEYRREETRENSSRDDDNSGLSGGDTGWGSSSSDDNSSSSSDSSSGSSGDDSSFGDSGGDSGSSGSDSGF